MRLIGKISQLTDDVCSVEISAGHIDTELIGQDVVIEVNKYRNKRSLSANGYFWVLIGQIARAIGSDKETVYLWMIRDSANYVSLRVIPEAIPTLQKNFRYVEQVGSDDGMVDVLCYYGTSTYNTKEMSHIIDLARQEAIKLGCDVWSKEEIERLFNEKN